MRSRRIESLYLSDVRERAYCAPDSWRERVRERLDDGAEEYGDKSYRLPPAQLLDEIEQEALDLVAWSSILLAAMYRRAVIVDEVREHLVDLGVLGAKAAMHVELLRELIHD